MKLASFLFSIAVAVAALTAVSADARGFYTDPHSFFSAFVAGDSTHALIVIRQSRCDLGAREASLIAGDLMLRPRSRYEVRIGLQFPAVRDREGIRYGVGDIMLRATARVAGDSARASGLFLRADGRIPTGSPSLRPFSDALLEAEGGLEVRLETRGVAVRAVGLYTIVAAERQAIDFSNDAHSTLAASVGAGLPAFLRIDVAAFLLRFDSGGQRSIFALSIGRELSPQLRFELAGAAESGDAGTRVFDSSVSASIEYLFPPRRRAESADSPKP